MTLNNLFDPIKSLLARFGANYFFGLPADTVAVWYWFGLFFVALFGSLGYYIVLRRKSTSVKPYRVFASTFFWPNLTLSIVGIFLIFFRYENIQVLSYRFWVFLLLVIMLVFNVWFFVRRRQELDEELLKFAENKRKGKWLKTNRK